MVLWKLIKSFPLAHGRSHPKLIAKWEQLKRKLHEVVRRLPSGTCLSLTPPGSSVLPVCSSCFLTTYKSHWRVSTNETFLLSSVFQYLLQHGCWIPGQTTWKLKCAQDSQWMSKKIISQRRLCLWRRLMLKKCLHSSQRRVGKVKKNTRTRLGENFPCQQVKLSPRWHNICPWLWPGISPVKPLGNGLPLIESGSTVLERAMSRCNVHCNESSGIAKENGPWNLRDVWLSAGNYFFCPSPQRFQISTFRFSKSEMMVSTTCTTTYLSYFSPVSGAV